MAHGLSCFVACGIFSDQGSNLCPLHWQVDSQPLQHQGSPCQYFRILFIPLFKVPLFFNVLSFYGNIKCDTKTWHDARHKTMVFYQVGGAGFLFLMACLFYLDSIILYKPSSIPTSDYPYSFFLPYTQFYNVTSNALK